MTGGTGGADEVLLLRYEDDEGHAEEEDCAEAYGASKAAAVEGLYGSVGSKTGAREPLEGMAGLAGERTLVRPLTPDSDV